MEKFHQEILEDTDLTVFFSMRGSPTYLEICTLEEGSLWQMTSNLASSHEIGRHGRAQVRRKSFRLASINNLIS
jgi:hypothetical protein